MIGLLEGMIIPQPKGSQAASGQQSAIPTEAEQQSTPDSLVPQEAFLSVLFQQLVALVPLQIPPTPSAPQTENVLSPDGSNNEASPLLQGDISGKFVQQSEQMAFPRIVSAETQQEGIALPVSLMKAIPQEKSDEVMRDLGLSETEFPSEAPTTTLRVLGIQIAKPAEQFLSKNENQQNSKGNIPASTLTNETRQDQSGVTVVSERGPVRPSSSNPLSVISALSPETEIQVRIVDSPIREMPRFAGTTATPQSMAELKTVVERFSIGLPLGGSTRTIEAKANDGEAVLLDSGQEIAEQKPLFIDRAVDSERPQGHFAKAEFASSSPESPRELDAVQSPHVRPTTVSENKQGMKTEERPDDVKMSEVKAAVSPSVKPAEREAVQSVKWPSGVVQTSNAISSSMRPAEKEAAQSVKLPSVVVQTSNGIGPSMKPAEKEAAQSVKWPSAVVQTNTAIRPTLSTRRPSGEYEPNERELTQAAEHQVIKQNITSNSTIEPAEKDSPAMIQLPDKPLAHQEKREGETENQNANPSSNEEAQRPSVKGTATRFEIDTQSNLARGVTTKPVVEGIVAATSQPKLETSFIAKDGVRVFSNQPAMPEDFAKNLMVKISDEVKLHVEGKSSEVRVMMKPESLGELSLRVTMHEGKLVAQMDVTQSAVKNALEAQLPQMREALASQGIDIHRFEIVSGGETQFQRQSEGSAFRQQHRSRRQMDVEVIEDLDGMKYLGYNTVEYII